MVWFLAWLFASPLGWGNAMASLSVNHPCSLSEVWQTTGTSPSLSLLEERLVEMNSLFSGKSFPTQSFSNALAFKRAALTPQDSLLSEYWISRSLQQAGFIHLAHQAFGLIVNQSPTSEILPIQLASLACLVSIQQHTAAMNLGGLTPQQLGKLFYSLNANPLLLEWVKPTLWRAGALLTLERGHKTSRSSNPLEEGESHLPDLVQELQGAGAYENFSKIILAASRLNYSQIQDPLNFLLTDTVNKDFFNPYLDHLKLLGARASYGLGQYEQAIAQYRSISPRSNEWVDALSELSWSYLQAEKYREAIGAGIGLQSGSLKKTFAPEAMMVMAISLNEMCRYPEARTVIGLFKKKYYEGFQWLKSEANQALDGKQLYHLAVQFTKRDPLFRVPPIVASEWIRSPYFLANQERMNLAFREKANISSFNLKGIEEKKKQLLLLIKKANEILSRLIAAQESHKEDFLTPSLVNEIKVLKQEMIQYQRLKYALPLLERMIAHGASRNKGLEREAVEQMGAEIKKQNLHMRQLLGEIGENIDLLEIEIWNGASEDIVWKNAHPDYEKTALIIKESKGDAPREVWNWGKVEGGFDGKGEVWEDELGSFSADLYDNCESKDRYLGLGRREER